MAHSTCENCEGNSFELAEVSPFGGSFKYYFVQCASCGVPAGIVEWTNIGAGIEALESKLGEISDKLDAVEYSIRRLKV